MIPTPVRPPAAPGSMKPRPKRITVGGGANKSALPDLEQINALKLYRDTYGPNWKMILIDEWSGSEIERENSHILQQIRNRFGPSWLYSFILPA